MRHRIGTRVKPISAALLYLPGFAPGEEVFSVASLPPQNTSLSVIPPEATVIPPRPVAVKMARKVWPSLGAEDFAPSGITESQRVEMNLKALRGAHGGEATRQDLTRYSGWGAAPKVFDLSGPHKDARDELLSILGNEAFSEAASSVNTAFFTPMEVCHAVWHWIAQAGFSGGRILECSAGIGNLIGTMPKEIAENSSVVAVEKDHATAAILKRLYGEHGVKVHAAGFEAVPLADDSFDLVVSNVPFGNFSVPELRNKPYKNWLIHDYFFAKSMEVVRPGGLVVLMTSRGTLDKSGGGVRRWLSAHADLVGAIRLPVECFKAFAGTEACVDIVILKKRDAAAEMKRADWIDVKAFEDRSSLGVVNPLFVSGGQGRVVGKLISSSGRFGRQIESTSEDWKADLAKAVTEYVLPKCYEKKALAQEGRVPERVSIAPHKPGCYLVVDGRLMMSLGYEAEPVSLSKDAEDRVLAMLPIRETVRALVKTQVEIEDEAPLEALRIQLHTQYDGFVKRYGRLQEKKNLTALRADADYPLLMGLERVDEQGGYSKASLFYQRTARSTVTATTAGSLAEAVQVNLAESAGVNPGRIASLLGWSMDEVIAGLVEEALAFHCPQTGRWEPAFSYLSGDVKSKLEAAEAAGPEFAVNVTALKSVLPADVQAHEIAIRLGANWVPSQIYREFAQAVLGMKINLRYVEAAGTWAMDDRVPHGGVAAFGTRRMDSAKLFLLGMNQKEPEVKDRGHEGKYVVNVPETLAAKEKLQAIKDAFIKWAWSDEARTENLVRIYNQTMNRHVEAAWDGSLLTLPGFSDCVKLHKHQKDAIWRTVVSGRNTLLAHCVGAGKTLTMVCAGMEMRRTGKARKPMYVVPNHMLEQFSYEFLRAYPGASLLMAAKEDLAKERRRQLTAKIALWDWDAIVITHSSFEKVTASESLIKSFIKENLMKIEMAMVDADDASRKQIEAQKSSLESKLKKLTTKDRKDDLLEFRELGVDMLFVDEAHAYKNVWRLTRMTRISGLPLTESQRAFDMLMKVREITEIRKDHQGVVFATGTPVANSLGELWVMQSYLQPAALSQSGFSCFDSWAANFGESVTGIEVRPDGGGYRVNTRFARFVNLPEVMSIFKQVADIRTKEMLSLPTPAVERITVAAKATDALKSFVAALVERVEKIQSGEVKPDQDNMLSVTSDGRKAATDMRLVGGCDHPESKINLCVARILKEWESSREGLGTQIVFLDLATPGAGKHWSLYDDMKDKLVALGIPAHEIAFIHDANTDKAKEALFEKVRTGSVRVLFGSTSKMGVGTNVQTRLVALHHIDAPWRPADVEQREGRIERQGNMNASVRIFRYVTEGSFDAYMWQTLETKAKFIAQVMSGGNLRSVEDLEMAALSYAEVKALASGNPLVIEKAGVDADVNRLVMLRKQWVSENSNLRFDARNLPSQIEDCKRRIRLASRDAEMLSDVRGTAFSITLDGKVITDRKQATNRLMLAIYEANPHRGPQRIGQYAGLELSVEASLSGVRLVLEGQGTYRTGGTLTPLSVLTELLDLVRDIEQAPDRAERHLRSLEDRLARTLSQLDGSTWEHEARFASLLARQAEIDAALGIGQSARAAFEDDLDQAA